MRDQPPTIAQSGTSNHFTVVVRQQGAWQTNLLPVADAYGPRKPGLVLDVDRSEFPPDIEPRIGLNLRMEQADGSTVNVAITNVAENMVTLDANHPLAGEDLVFDIELVEIIAA